MTLTGIKYKVTQVQMQLRGRTTINAASCAETANKLRWQFSKIVKPGRVDSTKWSRT